MDEYIDCKKNILIHQNAFSRAILNRENAETMKLSRFIRGEILTFGRQTLPVFDGSFCDDDGYLCLTRKGVITRLTHKDSIKILGTHNIENYLAAIAALAGEVSTETVKNVAENFGGVPHRIEFIREKDGVKFYNDSIATSPTRVIAGLRAFNRKIIVIAGGYDKKIPYEPLGEDVNKYVKVLVTLGATAEKIENAVKSHKDYNPETIKIIRTQTLEEAVKEAQKSAQSGDVITLSPASASFDLYRNFEERGEHFKRIVNAL
jgi:UDP-N-acetylmuramoylalanine--D-glutamate ligase